MHHHSLYREVEDIKKDIHYYNFIKSIIRLFSVQFRRCVPVIDRYRITGICGTGGNGIVYRVVSVSDGREFALKIPYLSYYMIDRYHLTVEHMHDDPYEKIDEIAEDLASLFFSVRAHPQRVRKDFYRISEERSYNREFFSMRAVAGQKNMVYLNDFGTFDLISKRDEYPDEIRKLAYFVMPLFQGVPLRDYMNRTTQPEEKWEQAFRILGNAIDIVDAAHHCGVIHRDLHPGNFIYQNETEELSLIDFGSSLTDCGDRELDTDGENRGSKRYMSPEQFANPRDADIRSDYFCIGGLLFFMLTSLSLFDRDRKKETLPRSPEEYIRRPDVIPEVLYRRVTGFINRLTRFRREERYQTIEEIRREWNDILKMAEKKGGIIRV